MNFFFQKHLDIAIQLLPEEPVLYYLKGRRNKIGKLSSKNDAGLENDFHKELAEAVNSCLFP